MTEKQYVRKLKQIKDFTQQQVDFAEMAFLNGFCTKKEMERAKDLIIKEGAKEMVDLIGFYENQDVLQKESV